jgi:HK97 family phage major capsid protein
VPRSAAELVRQYQQIYERADSEGRDLTRDETDRVADLVERAGKQKKLEDRINDFGLSLGPAPSRNSSTSWGEAFVNSSGYKSIKSNRGQTWSSGPVEVPYEMKGTLLEGAGGTLVPPHYTGGIVRTNFTQVGLVDYFGQQQTTSNSVRYSLEGTATSAVAGVAEGGVKPESTLALNEVTEPVRKLATVLPLSDELLDDAAGITSYINERLTMFLRVKEEEQILRGAGGNDLSGIFSRGISTLGLGTAVANHVQIFRAAAGIRGSAFVDPDLVVVHPNDWVTMRLRTDSAGQYLGGGPWQGPYGQTSQVSAGYFSSAPLWGMNVFVSPVVGAGTALVGNAREAARIYRRGGVSLESTNSHGDLFVRNISMIRAEERLALAVFRPTAWCAVTTMGTIG